MDTGDGGTNSGGRSRRCETYFSTRRQCSRNFLAA